MIAFLDVHYFDGYANAAAVLADEWADSTAADQLVVRCGDIGEYHSGSFYLRELKPLQQLLQLIDYSIDCH